MNVLVHNVGGLPDRFRSLVANAPSQADRDFPWIPFAVVGLLLSGVLFVFGVFITGRLTLRQMLQRLAIALGALVGIVLLTAIIDARDYASSAFAVIALLVYVRYGAQPFQFYKEYLYTEPSLKPATREQQADDREAIPRK